MTNKKIRVEADQTKKRPKPSSNQKGFNEVQTKAKYKSMKKTQGAKNRNVRGDTGGDAGGTHRVTSQGKTE